MVINHGDVSVQLEEGLCLETLEEVEVMEPDSENQPLPGPDGCVAAVFRNSVALEGVQQLLEELKTTLSPLA